MSALARMGTPGIGRMSKRLSAQSTRWIALFELYLILSSVTFEPYQIHGPGAISYAPLEQVVERRGWQGTEAFDVLVAPDDCRLLARWAWLVTESGIYSALVVDCESPEHAGQMTERGLLVDCNRRELVHERGWLVVR